MVNYVIIVIGDGTFSFEEFVQVMANMGGLSEQSEEDEEKELRQAFTVSQRVGHSYSIYTTEKPIEC